MARGGRRPGAGRPTVFQQMQKADQAAEAVLKRLQDAPLPSHGETLKELLAIYRRELIAEQAKGKHASKHHLLDCAAGLRATLELFATFEKINPTTEAVPQCVVRAPQIEPDAETWRAKYAPEPGSESPKPLADPELDRLQQFAIAASEPPPKPKLVWDADQPPAREQSTECWGGPHEFGPLGPAQIADLKRRGRL